LPKGRRIMIIQEALGRIKELRSEVGPTRSEYTKGYKDALSYIEEMVQDLMWESGVDLDDEEYEGEVGQR
jgi:hypothetical protein